MTPLMHFVKPIVRWIFVNLILSGRISLYSPSAQVLYNELCEKRIQDRMNVCWLAVVLYYGSFRHGSGLPC